MCKVDLDVLFIMPYIRHLSLSMFLLLSLFLSLSVRFFLPREASLSDSLPVSSCLIFVLPLFLSPSPNYKLIFSSRNKIKEYDSSFVCFCDFLSDGKETFGSPKLPTQVSRPLPWSTGRTLTVSICLVWVNGKLIGSMAEEGRNASSLLTLVSDPSDFPDLILPSMGRNNKK